MAYLDLVPYPHNPQERESACRNYSRSWWKVGRLQPEWNQMSFEAGEAVIDEIVASCDGDMRGALMALLMINEKLEDELQRLYAAVREGNTLH
ncbi:hypothetical protein [Nitrobacter sp. TKz-YC02]|jgi:hypothetical protein